MMEELGMRKGTIRATLGALSPEAAARGRLRLLGWRARRGWFGRSGLWALAHARCVDACYARSRGVTMTTAPSLSRVTRADLDLTFRSRGETALVLVAYHARAVAGVTFRGGVLLLGVGTVVAILVPLTPALMGLVALIMLGLASLVLAGVAKAVSFLADLPARATRAVRLQRWSTPSAASGGPLDGRRTVMRGRVVALRTLQALDGRPAVFARVRATRSGRRAELLRAEDFLIDDGTGAPTRVQVQHALYLDRPARLFGSWISPPLEVFPLLPPGVIPVDLEEAALHPGDEVEIVGRSEMVVDPSISDRLARATPLVRVLSGTSDEPLLVRSVL
jgi:hypothetical protein